MKLFISTRIGLQEWIVTAKMKFRVEKTVKEMNKTQIVSQSQILITKVTKVALTTTMKKNLFQICKEASEDSDSYSDDECSNETFLGMPEMKVKKCRETVFE